MKKFRNVSEITIECLRCGAAYPLLRVISLYENQYGEKLRVYRCPMCDRGESVGIEWKPVNRK